jgi:hypothetical protein
MASRPSRGPRATGLASRGAPAASQPFLNACDAAASRRTHVLAAAAAPAFAQAAVAAAATGGAPLLKRHKSEPSKPASAAAPSLPVPADFGSAMSQCDLSGGDGGPVRRPSRRRRGGGHGVGAPARQARAAARAKVDAAWHAAARHRKDVGALFVAVAARPKVGLLSLLFPLLLALSRRSSGCFISIKVQFR